LFSKIRDKYDIDYIINSSPTNKHDSKEVAELDNKLTSELMLQASKDHKKKLENEKTQPSIINFFQITITGLEISSNGHLLKRN
jgi:hypothetical protein